MELNRKRIVLLFTVLFLLLLSTGCSQSAGSKADAKLELAVKYLAENQFEAAVLAYQEVIKIDPKNVKAYKGLSVAYSLQDNLNESVNILKDGLSNVDDPCSLKLALAEVLLDLGHHDKVENLYKEIIAQNATYIPAYQAYINFLISEEKTTEAVLLLERVVNSNEQDYHYFNLLAKAYLQNGNYNEAVDAVKQSLNLTVDQTEVYKILGNIYVDWWQEFDALGDQLIEEGNNSGGWVLKLTALYEQGQYQQIINQYELLTSEVQQSTKIKLMVVNSFIKLGNAADAREIIKGIEIKKTGESTLLAELADCYLQLGDKATAKKLALHGIKLDSMDVNNYAVLYVCYLDEEPSTAKSWLIKYLLNSREGASKAIEELLVGVSTINSDLLDKSTPLLSQMNLKYPIVSTKKINATSSTLDIDMEIPYVIGLDNTHFQQNLNSQIMNKALKTKVEMEEFVGEYEHEVIAGQRNDLSSSYRYIISNKVLTLIVSTGQYYTGAAHGLHWSDYYNVDIKNGKLLLLKDLFKENANYKAVINEKIREEISYSISEGNLYFTGNEGFTSISDNQSFYLEDNNIVICFGLYEIAPYVSGMPEFKIPLNSLSNILKEDFLN